MEEPKGRSGWAIVEVMGHVTVAGYVTETTLAGAGVLAIAVPDGDRTVEQLISPTSLYRLTWTGEAEARMVAKRNPVQVIDDWTVRQEVRAQIEDQERESIELRIRRDVERELLLAKSDAQSVRQTPPETYFSGADDEDDVSSGQQDDDMGRRW